MTGIKQFSFMFHRCTLRVHPFWEVPPFVFKPFFGRRLRWVNSFLFWCVVETAVSNSVSLLILFNVRNLLRFYTSLPSCMSLVHTMSRNKREIEGSALDLQQLFIHICQCARCLTDIIGNIIAKEFKREHVENASEMRWAVDEQCVLSGCFD